MIYCKNGYGTGVYTLCGDILVRQKSEMYSQYISNKNILNNALMFKGITTKDNIPICTVVHEVLNFLFNAT